VAVNGVYGFWWYGYVAGGGSAKLIGTEAVSPGSTAANDTDPSVRYRDNLYTGTVAAANIQWWEAYGLPGAVYRTGGALGFVFGATGAVNLWPGANGTTALSPYTGAVPMFGMMYVQGGALPKGYSTELVTFSTTQNPCDTFNLSTSNPRVSMYGSGASNWGTAMPWVTSVVPLV
jgi:hypothetical protein